MAVYDVKAVALDPRTGRLVAGPRVERIDTHRNVLFTECRSEWEVEEVYEAFWNRLNDSWETDFPAGKEKVKVVSVERVVTSTPVWWSVVEGPRRAEPRGDRPA